ncbi:sterol-binding protein SKDI_11G2240 [Saccharomyces kudriavzevii IFO 1802]|uniref:Uncharacterized protein n=2 Tax=Saccharomyces kudriavzevii (strain ATCC MYA-4449 / AS 2.2408 / CBS 8840 / NBRC 1802 / NCYC 2889) TaxID=226230 RepID=A0AA35NJV6_SACK1|nr:uncharacterized protein SKDI_11G2240 [Saccharomyces kudriavzevii IFO 1802]EJT44265.1 PRY2-like protein [Saccharomyces kudriavzevii IFO 1802]CAI4045091.1 hypothetical protein SKDI_11G2240 [Saccharomyces kudriavzevii IFO 1802]
MKFSKVSLLVASASVALSAPVAVTVTQHVHQAATVVVQGIVYVDNGQTLTTFVTKNPPTPAAADTATATATVAAITTATASAPIVVANAQVDSVASSVIQESAVAEPTTSEEFSTAFSEAFSTATSEGFSTATTIVQSEQVSTLAAQEDVTTSSTSSAQPTTTATPTTTTATPTTTTASPTTASATHSSDSDFSTSMVNEHNTKRALHKDTGSLTWSDTLATYAQNYADSYDCSGNLVHSGGPYGENLALGYGTTGSVDAWYNEISSYDYSNPGFSESAGHFTQVVWKGTSEVGCGLKSCGGAWGDYIICSYKDAGNYIGEFAENVMPLA